jgi:hypothetical protein
MVRLLLSPAWQDKRSYDPPSMVLAITILLLHLAPAADIRAGADVSAAIQPVGANATETTTASTSTPSSHGVELRSISDSATTTDLANASASAQSFSNIRIPDPQPAQPLRLIPVENMPSRRNWLILSVVQHGAATFDAYTTRQAIAAGAREDDPLIRPFAHSPAIYFASQVGPLALDYAARRMQRSQHAFLRRSWWLPQSASTGLFILSGIHNTRVSPHP